MYLSIKYWWVPGSARCDELPRVLSTAGAFEVKLPAGRVGDGGELPSAYRTGGQVHRAELTGILEKEN